MNEMLGTRTPSHWPQAAIAYCKQLTQAHSKTFYLGSCFFGLPQRYAVWAVYAACRAGDDTVDEGNPATKASRLEHWWEHTSAALQNTTPAQPDSLHPQISEALRWAAQHYELPLEAFYELYLGLHMDLSAETYPTLQHLELYCRRVAGVVGWMITPICGYTGGQRTLEQALTLGKAMQLTNILRDVGEDLKRDRVYLPSDLMQQFGVSRSTLEAGVVTPEYRALLQHLVQLARQWYQEGEDGIMNLQGSGRLAVAVASRSYAGILNALEANDYDNLNQRAYLSGSQKLALVPQTWWALQTGQWHSSS